LEKILANDGIGIKYSKYRPTVTAKITIIVNRAVKLYFHR